MIAPAQSLRARRNATLTSVIDKIVIFGLTVLLFMSVELIIYGYFIHYRVSFRIRKVKGVLSIVPLLIFTSLAMAIFIVWVFKRKSMFSVCAPNNKLISRVFLGYYSILWNIVFLSPSCYIVFETKWSYYAKYVYCFITFSVAVTLLYLLDRCFSNMNSAVTVEGLRSKSSRRDVSISDAEGDSYLKRNGVVRLIYQLYFTESLVRPLFYCFIASAIFFFLHLSRGGGIFYTPFD